MESLFMQVFSCCLGRRSREPDIADDRSRLIPATTEPSLENVYDVVVTDQRKFKQRLGSIVRDKEGKMVNVTSHLPFNLYNRTLAAQDPSSSRSTSTTRESQSQSPLTYQPRTRSGLQTTSTFPAQRSPSRKSSRSGSPRSSISSRRGRAIRSVDGQIDNEELSSQRPILNVRLVRGCGVVTAGRRGRTRLKMGESSQPEPKEKDGDLDVDLRSAVGTESPDVLDGLGGVISSSNNQVAPIATLHGVQDQDNSCSFPQLSISPASDIDFRIEDMGAITLSWDD
ncbi:hypothetical protein BDZ94DRAFT_1359451 [Collybia nuda]|uniref:Uncharacterized protein n=1 Tax=Collybia nuda TaxID=64659 RepID=A0A9P5XS45_9AGAR|nr:hypothetical protein BDZ94DRAFT_1359451 [Collybia nuda]